MLAVHQRHDYSHVGSRTAVFGGVEAQQNAAIVDDWRHYHSIAYAPLSSTERLGGARAGSAYRLARPRSVRRAHAALRARSGDSCSASRPRGGAPPYRVHVVPGL